MQARERAGQLPALRAAQCGDLGAGCARHRHQDRHTVRLAERAVGQRARGPAWHERVRPPTDRRRRRSARSAENTPSGAIAAPVLVAQGTSDEVVPIGITQAWVAARCAAGQPVDFRTILPGLDHTGSAGCGLAAQRADRELDRDRLSGPPRNANR